MAASGTIVLSQDAPPGLHHAGRDLQRYLVTATGAHIDLATSGELQSNAVQFAIGYLGDRGLGDSLVEHLTLSVPEGPEGYHVRRQDNLVAVVGSDVSGAVYGVYALLEDAYECGFFLGSEVVPPGDRDILPATLDLQRSPAFAVRGLLPWYDFLSGPTAWNLRDYKLYIDRMVRMGLNFLGLHVYSTGSVNQSGGAEPFLSFTHHGVGHDGYLDTTQTSRWGYLPMRTSQFSYGTDHFFAGEVFGADAALEATDPLDAARRGKALLGAALDYAKARGLMVCVGFEPAAVPLEILNALPSTAKRRLRWKGGEIENLDLTTTIARDILHTRIDDLLDTYPQVDAIWLWQNEDAAWTTQRTNDEILPFDASYLAEARQYVGERAPHVRTVVSGWGAVHSLFDQLHQDLPADMPFAALHHNLGTTETDDVYGRLGERSRWPIPWLEDDATLWHPQFYVDRFRNDVQRAANFGADGMIGIHWRTRVIDHIASYFARALWNPGLSTREFYEWYTDRLVGTEHSPALTDRLDQIDRTHAWPGYLSDDHVGSIEWAHGHSNEAGAAFNPLDTPDDVLREFETYLEQLARCAEAADATEAERARYHLAQGRFARRYVDSQRAAARIDELVQFARNDDRQLSAEEFEEACDRYRDIDTAVRDAIEAFAAVQTTTADLGVLASLNQKYVTRALWQRHDALREVSADPSTVPIPNLAPSPEIPPRVFVPAPPESIPTEGTEIMAVVSTFGVTAASVCTMPLAGGDTSRTSLTNQGRGVWTGSLQSREPVRYWIEAHHEGKGLLRAPEAPTATFSAIIED
jgi:hypothetical protein